MELEEKLNEIFKACTLNISSVIKCHRYDLYENDRIVCATIDCNFN